MVNKNSSLVQINVILYFHLNEFLHRIISLDIYFNSSFAFIFVTLSISIKIKYIYEIGARKKTV